MENRGITLIALIITIIILLILAGVTINLTLGENGILTTTKTAEEQYQEQQAKEKLEVILIDLQAKKIADPEYNENEYIDKRLQEEKMDIEENIATVDGWRFEIDRSIPEIAQSLGKETQFASETKGKASFVYDAQTKYLAKVSVSINIDPSLGKYVVQYNITENNKESLNWVDYLEGNSFEVTKNGKIYGRIVNLDTNEIGYKFIANITNIDDVSPQKATIEFDKTTVETNETIQATVQQNDMELGMDIENSKYIINNSSDEIGVDSDSWNSAEIFSATPQTIDITQSQTGTYYLHVLSVDFAGNKTETVSSAIKFKGEVTYLNVNYFGQNMSGWTVVGSESTAQLRTSSMAYTYTNARNDFSDVNTLIFKFKAKTNFIGANGSVTLGLVSNPSSTDFIVSKSVSFSISGASELTLDTSAVVGSYYIKILLCCDNSKYVSIITDNASIIGK